MPGCERADYDSTQPRRKLVTWLDSGQLLRRVSICHVPVCPHKSSRLSLLATSASNRQSAVAISSCHRTLPFWLLSAQTVASEHSAIDSGCCEDFSPLQAFIACRLDYCNSLLYGVSYGSPEVTAKNKFLCSAH